MCSFIGQILYGGVMLAALGLTLGSMFTPEWRRVTNTQGGMTDGSVGLFDFNCKLNNPNDCFALFNARPAWEKAVIIAMIVAVVVEALAVLWTILSFFTCCCRKNILHPLSGFALIAAIALIVALAVFYSQYKQQIDGQNWQQLANLSNIQNNSNLGYSFFLGCAALAGCIIGIIIGALLSCMVKKE
ncbi:hypothetical protein M3Y97_00219000 [Aphelenchoides bicaudatus]|nr:hypothetical protein M3Y97_00219000 [Aphelenchoides bicaudatus]